MDRVVELTKNLISIPSVSGNEDEISRFIAGYIEKGCGIAPELMDVPGFGPNLIARSESIEGAMTIVLNAHTDTVAPVKAWEQDPFSPQEHDGVLFGLGGADMKAGLAIAIETFVRCANEVDLNLVFTACPEEEGASSGVNALLSDPDLGGDLCLIPEPSNENVMLGARGRFVIDIDIWGKAAHGARPDEGINALEEAARVVSRLNEIELRHHPLFESGSVCTLRIEGGTDSLSVPDRCNIVVDRHVVPGETEEQILLDFQEHIGSVGIRSNWRVSKKQRSTPYPLPYIFDKDEGIIKVFLESFRSEYQREPQLIYGKSVGDYNFMARRMPTIVFGPSGGMWHREGEYVEMASIERTLGLYTGFIENLQVRVRK